MPKHALPRRTVERFGPVRHREGPTAAPADRFVEAPPAPSVSQARKLLRAVQGEVERRQQQPAKRRRFGRGR